MKKHLTKVVIWGTKLEAEKVLFLCQVNNIECEYVIDSLEEGKLHGYKVKKFSDLNKISYFCVIACSEFDTYNTIKKKLEEKKLVEFNDYIWSKLWMRKLVVINANCHGSAVKKYLESSVEFCEKYAIYPVPEIWQNEKKEIDELLLQNIDVYIHQDIRHNNIISEKLSDDYIVPRLKKDVLNICIPNFVGYGNMCYPYICSGGYATRGTNPTLIMFQDTLLDDAYKNLKLQKKEIDISDILKFVNAKKLDLDKYFEEGLEKIRKREQNWDIKVSDYISNHRKDKRLFNDINHPGNGLMKFICDKVISLLGCKIIEYWNFGMGAEIPRILVDEECPIYKDIRDDNTNISLTSRPFNGYEDYVRQYIWLVYDEYLR